MAEKTVKVERHTYTRTIRAKQITFICRSHPGGPMEVTEEHLPGATPRYCVECQRNKSPYLLRQAAIANGFVNRTS